MNEEEDEIEIDIDGDDMMIEENIITIDDFNYKYGYDRFKYLALISVNMADKVEELDILIKEAAKYGLNIHLQWSYGNRSQYFATSEVFKEL